jgi:hypothetical protein
MGFTPGDDPVFDCALLQVVQHLIAGDPPLAGDRQGLVEILGIEIADAPRQYLAGLAKLFERGDRLL